MRIRHHRVLVTTILLALVALLTGLVFAGCATTGAAPKGWSGVEVGDGTLLFGSMEGKLVAIDVSSHNRKWADAELVAPKQSTAFGCAPASSSVAIYGTPAVADGLVFVSSYSGKIQAFNADSGALRWLYPRDGYLKPIVGGVTVATGKVYFGGSDGKVYALDAANGDFGWGFQTGDKIWSTPAIEGDTLYVGSFDGKLYALGAGDGGKKWEFEAEGGISSSPAVANSTVYAGSFDRHLYAVNAADGSLRWRSTPESGSWFWAKPLAYNNAVYAGCLDHKLYVLDANTGDERGQFDLGSPISSSPVLVGSSVIIASQEGVIYSLDTSSNQIKQLADLKNKVFAPLSAGDGLVYVHTQTNETVYALNAQTGAVLWSFPVSSK